MGCCSQVVDIGCFDFCSTISTGYNATESGVHTLEIHANWGTVKNVSATYTSGNDMTIASDTLNESAEMDIKIKKPSGAYYEFATDTFCIRLTTQVHIT